MKRCTVLLLLITFAMTSCSTPATVQLFQKDEYINTHLQYSTYNISDHVITIEFLLEAYDHELVLNNLLEVDSIHIKCNGLGYEYEKNSTGRELLLGTNYDVYIDGEPIENLESVNLINDETYLITFEFTFDDLDGDITFQYAYFFSNGYHFGVN